MIPQLKIRIINFIEDYGIRVGINEDPAITELMMDNHKCIEFDGDEYYIPEDFAFEGDEEEIYDYLIENYSL